MRPNIVLVTVECLRWDHRDTIDLPPGFDATKGIAPGHYTRPSLAGLLTGQYGSVVNTRAASPTLAEALSKAGYTTAAISYSPQTTTAFDFDAGFDTHYFQRPGDSRLSRGSGLRERLAELSTVRRLKRRLRDKHATFDSIPPDSVAQKQSRAVLRRLESDPVFLWVHFMGSHRPYGWGDAALPREVSRAAAGATPDDGDVAADAELRDTVAQHYRKALRRLSDHLTSLIGAASEDTVFVIAGDHGEELGEHGYFFHGGYRRRTVDELVSVPVFTRGLEIADEPVGLIDLPAHILARCREVRPDAWDARTKRDHQLTIAPWNDRATVRYQSDGVDLTFRDAQIEEIRTPIESNDRVQEQLEALGYTGTG